MNHTPPPTTLPDRGAGVPASSGATTSFAADGLVDRLLIPVIEEVATIDKQRVETGYAVRVRKQVREDEVAFAESVAYDELQVERVAIDRVLDGPVGVRQEGDVTIVPVVEERLVTVKQLVLVEEVRITRQARVRPLPVAVTLRREEVVVERFDPASGVWRVEPEAGALGTTVAATSTATSTETSAATSMATSAATSTPSPGG